MMKKMLLFLFITGLYLFNPTSLNAQEKFKVVLDAGHGGKEPGNLGSGYFEKDITLKIALEVGKLLEKNESIEVLYTRKDDSFVGLKERGEFAHKNDANIFVSIHCDAFDNSKVYGVGTFVLASRGNGGNFRIAQKENSVISYEENYKSKYKGFDPESIESIIGITMIQEEFLDESLLLANFIQKKMVEKTGKKDRLVKQDNFQVLRETFMPSVLVETGFLTNKNEGAYLNSKKGQQEIAKAIYEGVVDYKEVFDANTVVEAPEPKPKKKPKKEKKEKPRTFNGVKFKVQIASSARKVNTASKNFKGLKNIERVKVGAHHKYYYGSTSDYNKVKKFQKEAKDKGYVGAFVVAFKNGKKVSVHSILNSK